MNITQLIEELASMYKVYGDVPVLIDSIQIERVIHVNAVLGEHKEYIDLVTYDD